MASRTREARIIDAVACPRCGAQGWGVLPQSGAAQFRARTTRPTLAAGTLPRRAPRRLAALEGMMKLSYYESCPVCGGSLNPLQNPRQTTNCGSGGASPAERRVAHADNLDDAAEEAELFQSESPEDGFIGTSIRDHLLPTADTDAMRARAKWLREKRQ